MGNKNSEIFDYVRGFTCDFDSVTGVSKTAVPTSRKLSQMKGMFADDEAYAAALEKEDTVVYDFYEMGAPESEGEIAMGTSILHPGKIGDEYYFTKGHYHSKLDTAEAYYCLSGEGFMLIENPEGDWRAIPMKGGEAVYVPKRYAHRTVNTGKTDLVTFFAFGGEAGHDYGTIETKGYRKLIVERDGKPEIIDNPKWK